MQRTLLFVFSLLVCSMGVPEASAQKIYHIGALVAEDQFVPAFNGFKKKISIMIFIMPKGIGIVFKNWLKNWSTPSPILSLRPLPLLRRQ